MNHLGLYLFIILLAALWVAALIVMAVYADGPKEAVRLNVLKLKGKFVAEWALVALLLPGLVVCKLALTLVYFFPKDLVFAFKVSYAKLKGRDLVCELAQLAIEKDNLFTRKGNDLVLKGAGDGVAEGFLNGVKHTGSVPGSGAA